MKPVLYRYRDSESVIRAMDGYKPPEGWEPLYDQTEMDAAVAEERERCAQTVEKLNKMHWFNKQAEFAEFVADAIRKGE